MHDMKIITSYVPLEYMCMCPHCSVRPRLIRLFPSVPNTGYVLKYDRGEHLAVARWKMGAKAAKIILQPSFRMYQASNKSGVPSLLRVASKISKLEKSSLYTTYMRNGTSYQLLALMARICFNHTWKICYLLISLACSCENRLECSLTFVSLLSKGNTGHQGEIFVYARLVESLLVRTQFPT